MSELLLQWLNEHVKLSKHVKTVDKSFSNGFLFGELLYRLNHQNDFHQFVDSTKSDRIIRNFCLLYPVLRAINIRLRAQDAIAIILNDTEIASNLLYQIKLYFDELQHIPSVSCASHSFANIRMRIAKPIAEESDFRVFQSVLSKNLPEKLRIRQEMCNETHQMIQNDAQYVTQKKNWERMRMERLSHARLRAQMKKNETFTNDAFQIAMKQNRERKKRERTFLRRQTNERANRKNENIVRLRKEMESDLQNFEQKTQMFAEKRSTIGNSTDLQLQKLSNVQKLDEMRQRAEMFGQLETDELAQQNMELFVRNLFRSRNRKTTAEQKCISEALHALSYREIARENRKKRERRYCAQYTLEVNRSQRRKDACFSLLFQHVYDEINLQKEYRNRRELAKRSETRNDSLHFVKELLETFVTMSLLVTAHLQDMRLLRDFKCDFVAEQLEKDVYKDCKRLCQSHVTLSPSFSMLQFLEETEKKEIVQFLSEAHYKEFLEKDQCNAIASQMGTEAHSSDACPRIVFDTFTLGEAIQYARYIASDSKELENMSSHREHLQNECTETIRMLVLGDESVARHLALRFESHFFSLQSLVINAIQKRDLLGKKIHSILQSGQNIPIDIYGALAKEAIRHLDKESSFLLRRFVLFCEFLSLDSLREIEKHIFGSNEAVAAHVMKRYVSDLARGNQRNWQGCDIALPGFDLILHITRSSKNHFYRCFGQLKDRETCEEYHLFHTMPNEVEYHRLTPNFGSEVGTYSLVLGTMKEQRARMIGCDANMHNQIVICAETEMGLTCDALQSIAEERTIAFLQRKWAKEKEQFSESEARERLLQEDMHAKALYAMELNLHNASETIVNDEDVRDHEQSKSTSERMPTDPEMAERELEQYHSLFPLSAVPKSVYKEIAIFWDEMEHQYAQYWKRCFATIVCSRNDCFVHVHHIVRVLNSRRILFHRDERQNILNAFQRHYHNISEDLRCDTRTKEELHGRTDELHDRLMQIISDKRNHSLSMMENVLADKTFLFAIQNLQQARQETLQSECQRLSASALVLSQIFGSEEDKLSILSHCFASFDTIHEKSKSSVSSGNTFNQSDIQTIYDTVAHVIRERIELPHENLSISNKIFVHRMKNELQTSDERVFQLKKTIDQQILMIQTLSDAVKWKMNESIAQKERNEFSLLTDLIARIRNEIETENDQFLFEFQWDHIAVYTRAKPQNDSSSTLRNMKELNASHYAKEQQIALLKRACAETNDRRMHIRDVVSIIQRSTAQRSELPCVSSSFIANILSDYICEEISEYVEIDRILEAIDKNPFLFTAITDK